MGAERPFDFTVPKLDRPTGHRDDAARAILELGQQSDIAVNSGALLYIGEAHGWPSWLLEGTDFPPGMPIPPQIRVADELTIAANLYDRVDPFEFTVQIMRLPLANSAMTAAAFQVAPTLGHALAVRAASRSRATPHIKVDNFEGNEEGGLTVVSSHMQGRLFDAYAMGMLGLFFTMAGMMVPQLGRSARLELTIDGPGGALFASEVSCPVVFGAAENRLVIKRSALDQTNLRFDPALWEIVKRDLQSSPSKMIDSPGEMLLAKVGSYLDRHRVPRLKQIAGEMQMSERTIVRLLQAEGTSFRRLVDEERRSRAVDLLADPSMELAKVSEMLGFSDRPSFWRTFRRWFGVTPAQYRRD